MNKSVMTASNKDINNIKDDKVIKNVERNRDIKYNRNINLNIIFKKKESKGKKNILKKILSA